MENTQDYKFTLMYDGKTRIYYITGFILINGIWEKDGATLPFNYLANALESIKDSKENTFGKDAS